MKEIQPLPFVNKLPPRVRMPVYAAITLAGLAVAACGGTKASPETKSPGVTPTAPAAGETFTPTPTSETPKPTPEATPTPKIEPKNLFEAEIKPTIFNQLVQSIDSAFQAHPEVTIKSRLGDQQIPRENLQGSLRTCQLGDPQNPRFTRVAKLESCSNLATMLYVIYLTNGDEGFFDAAVNARNFLLSQLPDGQEKFDELVEAFLRISYLPYLPK